MRVVRGVGWLLFVGGAVILLYVVYLLWFTGLETNRAQAQLAERFGDLTMTVPGSGLDEPVAAPDDDEPVDVGGAYAAMWFERDGEHIVTDEPIYVVDDVTVAALRSGPGHYPETDRPGGAGNLAIAGHRTTYGAPFWSLDELRDGDTIHVVDRQGREWIYAYERQQIVAPTEMWVLEPDPLELGRPMITLTTCHPRGSARQRLIAFGTLVGEPIGSSADGEVRDELVES